MRLLRRAAAIVLAALVLTAFAAPFVAPHPYDRQYRDSPNARWSGKFLLGTDEYGRDRFSRLLYATAVSATLAPAAALTSVALAGAIAALPLRFVFSTVNGLFLSIPWIFPFIILRAYLPLNTSPGVSIALTFALIGVAGWAYPGRVFAASLREIETADWLLLARASGISPWRTWTVQVLPHLRDIAVAQFRALIPAYILSEASLGLLGLGVAEPLPSWGNMLLELQFPDRIRANPAILAPLALLMLVMVCLELLGNPTERNA